MATITALNGAKLADAVYRFDSKVGDYILALDKNNKPVTFSDSTTDLQMALYQKTTTGDYVVAFRGTSSLKDGATDPQMGVSTLISGRANQLAPASTTLSMWEALYSLSSSNTTLVGHSLGASLAQYFGASTGFETLTYNAYGVGNMNQVGGYSSNITNYITMHDPVSVLLRSKMVGTTYMLQDESLYDLAGHGIANFTSIDSWVRGYSLVDDPSSIDVIDGIGSSGLDSAYELALRLSEGRTFAMING